MKEELPPGAVELAPHGIRAEQVRLHRAVCDQGRAGATGLPDTGPRRLGEIEPQAHPPHAGLGARLDRDVGPILEPPVRHIRVHVAADITIGVGVLLLEDDPQRVAGSNRLNQLLAELIPIGGLPVRLQLVEAPLHGLGNVLGNLGAHDGRRVEMILEVQGHLCR